MRALTDRRKKVLGTGFRQYYDFPFNPVKGEGVWLFDAEGKRYLDVYNNVPHVGHCHPHVTEALCRQARTLNVHSRYLHDSVVRYAERLVATMPAPLDACMFTCTGSEANDLAWRIARTVSGSKGTIVTKGAYHGNTLFLNSIDGSNGLLAQAPEWCAFLPPPEFSAFAEPYSKDSYGKAMEEAIGGLAKESVRPAGFMFDSFFCSDGVFETPREFLLPAMSQVRAAGGFCIADEIQTGLGRVGSDLWGFQALGVLPDMVTLGKPMGNGHPIGAVVTRREIIEEFFARGRYFNTFAGNPVSSEAGNAVLDVMERESLQSNAASTGSGLREAIKRLASEFPIIGDIRGRGFLLGVEIVKDRNSREPAGREARFILNDLCRRGAVVGLTGPNRKSRNILKIRPPMNFSEEHVETFANALRETLQAARVQFP